MSTSWHTCYQHCTYLQSGFVKLDSHLNRHGMLCLQLWTNPAAAVLIYVWALSEVQHNPSGLIMSAYLQCQATCAHGAKESWHCKPQIARFAAAHGVLTGCLMLPAADV